MVSLKNYRCLKASSITESIIAISIISICVLVAFLIYLNVIKSNHPVGYFNARHYVEGLAKEIEKKKDFTDAVYEVDGCRIVKSATTNKDETVLLEFEIICGQKTFKLNKIVQYEMP